MDTAFGVLGICVIISLGCKVSDVGGTDAVGVGMDESIGGVIISNPGLGPGLDFLRLLRRVDEFLDLGTRGGRMGINALEVAGGYAWAEAEVDSSTTVEDIRPGSDGIRGNTTGFGCVERLTGSCSKVVV
jgi:hypothetical protein